MDTFDADYYLRTAAEPAWDFQAESREHIQLLQWLKKHGPWTKDVFLHIGCGIGHVVTYMMLEAWETYGWDISPFVHKLWNPHLIDTGVLFPSACSWEKPVPHGMILCDHLTYAPDLAKELALLQRLRPLVVVACHWALPEDGRVRDEDRPDRWTVNKMTLTAWISWMKEGGYKPLACPFYGRVFVRADTF